MPNGTITNQEIEKSLTNNITNRNYQLATIMRLLSSETTKIEGATVSLNGLWGSGKSYFVRSLDYLAGAEPKNYPSITSDEIERYQDRYITIYHNASENDHLEDPLGAILAQLLENVSRRQHTFQEKAIEKIEKSIDLAALIKNLTWNGIDFSKENTIDKIIKESITANERRETFQKILSSILPEEKSLLFIIDELDRCRPSFALDLIEAIHFYLSNDNIVFLIAINSRQLINNIDHRYGSYCNGGEYLDKYFDLQLTLQPIDKANYLRVKFSRILSTCNAQVEKIAEILELEPRELNHYVRTISLVLNYINAPHRGQIGTILRYYIAPLALGLSIKNYDEYLAIIHGNGREIISKYLKKSPVLVEAARSLAGSIESADKNLPLRDAQQIADKDIDEGIIKIICDQYEKVFSTKEYNYERELHSFLDAVSLLGALNPHAELLHD